MHYSLFMDIAADIAFHLEQEPGTRIAPMLRTVAALNPQASRAEFVEACVAAGYEAATATRCFSASRAFDTKHYQMVFNTAGRLVEEPVH